VTPDGRPLASVEREAAFAKELQAGIDDARVVEHAAAVFDLLDLDSA
jgi:hypothetical protein